MLVINCFFYSETVSGFSLKLKEWLFKLAHIVTIFLDTTSGYKTNGTSVGPVGMVASPAEVFPRWGMNEPTQPPPGQDGCIVVEPTTGLHVRSCRDKHQFMCKRRACLQGGIPGCLQIALFKARTLNLPLAFVILWIIIMSLTILIYSFLNICFILVTSNL